MLEVRGESRRSCPLPRREIPLQNCGCLTQLRSDLGPEISPRAPAFHKCKSGHVTPSLSSFKASPGAFPGGRAPSPP